MRFILECFCCGYFLVQSFANIARGMETWQQWVDVSAHAWRDEYAQRFCARARAAELNFAAARTFWAPRLDASLVDAAYREAWREWEQTLRPYEVFDGRCDLDIWVAKQEENASIAKLYPNWVVKHAH